MMLRTPTVLLLMEMDPDVISFCDWNALLNILPVCTVKEGTEMSPL
jgi:hypothetical protein